LWVNSCKWLYIFPSLESYVDLKCASMSIVLIYLIIRTNYLWCNFSYFFYINSRNLHNLCATLQVLQEKIFNNIKNHVRIEKDFFLTFLLFDNLVSLCLCLSTYFICNCYLLWYCLKKMYIDMLFFNAFFVWNHVNQKV